MSNYDSFKFRTASSLQLSYKKIGQGRPLLCLPGLGSNHYNFSYLAPTLSQNFEMIIIDHRGMGESEKVFNDYNLSDLADDAADLMNHLGYEKYDVIGISMGGFVAQLMALKFSERINRLALLCTTSGGEGYKVLPDLKDDDFRKVAALGERGIELSLLNTVYPDFVKSNPDSFKEIVKLRLENLADTEQAILQNRAAKKFLTEKIHLEEIKSKTLLLTGENDRFVNPENSKIMAKKISNSSVVTIPESDHFFFLEQPNQVAMELNTFFKE